MAGSPGAGKTEASIELIKEVSKNGIGVLRIDPDELRSLFEGYNGNNAPLFQYPVSILVDKIHDMALKNKQSFLLDGTLTNYDIAEKNIERSLKKKRVVLIIYVYQEPTQAWEFVLAREKDDGRKIKKETFIAQYFEARNVVNRLKNKFKKDIEVDLLTKNNDGSDKAYKANVDKIDVHIQEKYTKQKLEEILNLN